MIVTGRYRREFRHPVPRSQHRLAADPCADTVRTFHGRQHLPSQGLVFLAVKRGKRHAAPDDELVPEECPALPTTTPKAVPYSVLAQPSGLAAGSVLANDFPLDFPAPFA